MKPLTTPKAIIISGIVIAISIVVSTIIYVDANKYSFVWNANTDTVNAFTQDGACYNHDVDYEYSLKNPGKMSCWKKAPFWGNNLP